VKCSSDIAESPPGNPLYRVNISISGRTDAPPWKKEERNKRGEDVGQERYNPVAGSEQKSIEFHYTLPVSTCREIGSEADVKLKKGVDKWEIKKD
jgi:hypothetical protein